MCGIDWNAASWRSPGAGKHCSLVVAGDWAPIRAFAELATREPAAVYGDTLNVLEGADCRIVNLECPMSDGEPALKDGPNLRGGPEHWPCFDIPGFDAATIGNNHVLDFGPEALKNTIGMLDERGVRHTGAGMDLDEASRPVFLNVRGVKVGILSFSEGQDLSAAAADKPGVFGWDLDLVLRRVSEMRERCDFVLVIPHAGAEYIPFPPSYIRQAYRRIADAGADAVVAHHPHVPQGMEFRNGAAIFYSLGNYVFHQPVQYYYRKLGFLAELELDERGKLAGFKLHPYQICDRGLSLLRGERFSEFAALMEKLSRPLPEHGEEAWNAVLKERWRRGYVLNTLWGPLQTLEKDPRRGAAKWLNRLTSPCHHLFRIDVLKRVAAGTIDDAPEEYYRLAAEYNDRTISPELR